MANLQAVALGDFVISATPVTPEPGAAPALVLTDLKGWDNAAPIETETYKSRTGHGQEAGLRQLGAHSYTVQVAVLACPESTFSAADMVDDLKRLSRTTLRTIGATAREADVRVTQKLASRVSDLSYLVTLTLTADDPLRYNSGFVDLPAGTSLLPNSGDAQAFPVLEVSGLLTFYIAHPGASAAAPWKANVPSGKHIIHTRTGRMYNAASGALVPNTLFGPSPYVLPGGSEWTITGISSGLIRVRRWEAWS